jgi:hypothetical protein
MQDQSLTFVVCGISFLALMIIIAIFGTLNRINSAMRIMRGFKDGLLRNSSTPNTAKKLRWLIIVEIVSVAGVMLLTSLVLLGYPKQSSIWMTIVYFFLLLVGITTSVVLYREVIKKLQD